MIGVYDIMKVLFIGLSGQAINLIRVMEDIQTLDIMTISSSEVSTMSRIDVLEMVSMYDIIIYNQANTRYMNDTPIESIALSMVVLEKSNKFFQLSDSDEYLMLINEDRFGVLFDPLNDIDTVINYLMVA